jgi:hypothetical protein
LLRDRPKPLIWDLQCHLTSKIERAMLSLGYTLVENLSAQQFREQNDQVMRAVQRWPDRALGFVYLAVLQSLNETRDGEAIGRTITQPSVRRRV